MLFQVEPSTANLKLKDRKFGIDYIVNPKKAIDPLTIKLLIESPQNQYNLVCNVLMEVSECNDTEKLNDIAILCCEFTAQCSSLSSEWLGAFVALSNDTTAEGYQDLLSQVSVADQSIYGRLGTFAAILIARNCFSLQAFVISVAIPSLLQVWEKTKEGMPPGSKENEVGSRLSCHLLLKLFQSVDAFPPSFYPSSSGGTSPKAAASVTHHPSGIRFSCDRHLLSSAHRTIPVGAIIAVLKAILVVGDADGKGDEDSAPSKTGISKLLGGRGGSEDEDYGLGITISASRMDNSSLSDFAKHTLRQICSQV